MAVGDHGRKRLIDFVRDRGGQLAQRGQRVKIWGTARVVEGDDALVARLMPADYKARAEQVILINVTAWDSNCSQHIPQRFEADDVAAALAERDERIKALEARIAELLARR